MGRTDDTEFMTDLRAAVVRGPRVSASVLLLAIIGFLLAAVYWSSQAKLPLVTRGEGRVIPSSQVQIVEDLEGGIVKEILIREGDIVEQGQVLLRKDEIQFGSQLREEHAKYLAIQATVDRLTAEVNGRKPKYSKLVMDKNPKLAERENSLYRARREELQASVRVLERQQEQRRQELVEIAARIAQLERSLALAMEELAITKPMVEQGVMSRIELLRIERGVSDIEGTLTAARESVPRAQAASREAEQRIRERRANFRSQARAELNDTQVRLTVIKESLASMSDRVKRTQIRSPVDGTVKQLNINTIGGVIRPGMAVAEIVPLDDTLLVEARIRPADVGFLYPNQEAKVRITAYNSSDYGSLDARLEDISPDTIVDEKGESYFQVRVRTDRNYLESRQGPLEIKPGMVAQVDIRTGERTVLEYILKPILRVRESALRER